MKRKVAHHRKASRIHKKTHRHSQVPVFTLQRIIIVSCLVLVVFGVGIGYKNPDTRGVLGASIAKPLFNKATISLPNTYGATSFNIYYKASNDSGFIHAERVPANLPTSTINYLKRGVVYVYKISALKNGVEFWTSPIAQMSTQPM